MTDPDPAFTTPLIGREGVACYPGASLEPGFGALLVKIAHGHHSRAEFEKALAVLENCLADREADGDQEGIGHACVNLGALHLAMDDLQAALSYQRRGLEILAGIGDVRGAALASSRLGITRLSLGHLDEAREALEHALDTLTELGDTDGIRLTLHYLTETLLHKGDLTAALELSERAVVQAGTVDSQESPGMVHVLRARVLAARGEEWQASILHGLDRIEEGSVEMGQALCYHAELLMESDRRKAREFVTRAGELIGTGNRYWQDKVRELHARID